MQKRTTAKHWTINQKEQLRKNGVEVAGYMFSSVKRFIEKIERVPREESLTIRETKVKRWTIFNCKGKSEQGTSVQPINQHWQTDPETLTQTEGIPSFRGVV